MQLLMAALPNLIHRSLIWLACRTCMEPKDYNEADEVAMNGFWKEFMASKKTMPFTQSISYTDFFVSSHLRPDPAWTLRVNAMTDQFCQILSGFKILFPTVNRVKNVSDDTTLLFQQHNGNEGIGYVRTADLEAFYHETGEQVLGWCEIRMAWKFNDLKPRMYYCTGGQQYWKSRYVKKIAVALMQSIPSTRVKVRTNPDLALSSDPDTDYVVTWDYTSFTTSLSELKHFLWAIARLLENRKIILRIFDYRKGPIFVNSWDLIDDYNECANMAAPFSIHRMLDKFIEYDEDTILTHYQANSGMLGVHGNIGFSTALHGFVICSVCGEHRCCCVGDDGLGILPQDPNLELFVQLNKLGEIHPEKFGVLHPHAQAEEHLKFLKRRFERIGNSFVLSSLLCFPTPPYIDGQVGDRTRPPSFSLSDRIVKTVGQVASLLWEVQDFENIISDVEIDVMNSFLILTYRHLRLPFDGALPGYKINPDPKLNEDSFILNTVIPPIRGYSIRTTDWLDFLYESTPQMFFSLPRQGYPGDPPVLFAGDELECPEGAFLSALEDMKYVQLEKIFERVYVADISNLRRLRLMLKGERSDLVYMVYVRVLRSMPVAFLSMFSSGPSMDSIIPVEIL